MFLEQPQPQTLTVSNRDRRRGDYFRNPREPDLSVWRRLASRSRDLTLLSTPGAGRAEPATQRPNQDTARPSIHS